MMAITQGEIVLQTEDVLIRIMPLQVNGATAWHRHSAVCDRMLALEGQIVVEYRDPEQVVALRYGDLCTVESGRAHRVVNAGNRLARYLLIQGVGCYDFNVID